MTDNADVLRRAIVACVEGGDDDLAELFQPDVSFWSANVFASSLDELAEVLAGREDAFTDFELTMQTIDVDGQRAAAEWVAKGRFTAPFALDADTVLEPTGGIVVLAGATFAEIVDGKVAACRSYFDAGTLVEQMVSPPA
jgi:ketosteroid isomerase-like protein